MQWPGAGGGGLVDRRSLQHDGFTTGAPIYRHTTGKSIDTVRDMSVDGPRRVRALPSNDRFCNAFSYALC